MNRQVLDYLNEGVIIFDKNYSIQFCNQSLLDKLKYKKYELHNENIEKIIAEQTDSIIHEREKSIDTDISINLYDREGELVRAKGKKFREQWLGKESYWLIIKEYEEAKVSAQELEAVLENMPYAIWIADAEDNYKYTNSNTITMVNQLSSLNRLSSTDELLDQHPEEIYKYSLKKNIFKEDQSILKKGIMINEERISKDEKESLQYQIIKIPIFNEEQVYQGYIGISQYNILKQEVDIAKVIECNNPDFIVNEEMLYDQIVKSLEFNTRAARIFQGNNIIILKYNRTIDQVEEVGRLKNFTNELLSTYRLAISGSKLLELIKEKTEWALEEFEKRMSCNIKEESRVSGKSYIRINPIEYNGEFVGVIFTTYESKLQYPLMDSCIIDKLCQHIAIIFKSMEYALELRRELLIRKEVEAERVAYKEALQLETLKTEFLANMSHELKTPLSIMYSTAQLFELEFKEMVKEHNIGKTLKKLMRYKSVERQNIFRLMRLINNITDISKMGAGYYETKWVNCNIVEIIENITMSVVEYVKNKELSIVFDTEVEELVMACDPEKIERIMLNLLSNAVKYTNKGDSIEVNLSIENDRLNILVKDTGIGIPKEKQSMIFERFTQVDTSFTRMCEGSGIGLALVKCLVELQQGDIQVESEEGRGASFVITFPIQQIEGEKEVQRIEQVDTPKTERYIHRCDIEFSDIYDL